MGTDDSDQPPSLENLGRRIDAARSKRAPVGRDEVPKGPLGLALRLSVEMATGLAVGGAIGWGFDYLFGTLPLFLIIFFLAGAAAGMRTAWRTAKSINEDADGDGQAG